MERKPTVIEAIQALTSQGFGWDGDVGIIWPEKNTGDPPTQVEIDAKLVKLIAEYDAQEYARKREAEYPSIAELTVALYDEDDKTALETKRAAVKKKWPKDNSGPVE